jgi:hypothetical protein
MDRIDLVGDKTHLGQQVEPPRAGAGEHQRRAGCCGRLIHPPPIAGLGAIVCPNLPSGERMRERRV